MPIFTLIPEICLCSIYFATLSTIYMASVYWFCCWFFLAIVIGMYWYHTVHLIHIFLKANDVEKLFMCMFGIYTCFWWCISSNWMPIILMGCLFSCYWFWYFFMYSGYSLFADMWFANISSLSVNCFNFLNVVFQKTEVLNLDGFQRIIFLVCVCVPWFWHHILRIQVWCMRQVLRAGALGWPRGMGWRGRWEGGSGWGTHVNPWLIHINVWQKPLQYCKVISLQLI